MIGDSDTITLKDAAQHFGFSVYTLRSEAGRGRLTILQFIERIKAKFTEAKPRDPIPKRKPKPDPKVPSLSDDLIAMRRKYGADTPIGNRCINLVQKMKAHAECRDPARAAEIEKNMRREIAEIAELQRR